jgi:nucleoside-diphosphate-sugar epimerase
VESTEILLHTLEKLNTPVKRFLHVSSQAAVGPSPSTEPISEDQPCHPLTVYGKSKNQSEIITRKFRDKIPVTIVRPPVVYGPRDKDVLNLFKSINMGLNLMVGKTDQYVSIVYVEDLARGILEATFSEKTAGNTYFICEETPYYWSQVANLIAELLDRKFVTIKLPLPVANTIAFFMEMSGRLTKQSTILNREKMMEIKEPYWVISPQNARNDFQYSTQYPLEQGIQKTIEWYREYRWLS